MNQFSLIALILVWSSLFEDVHTVNLPLSVREESLLHWYWRDSDQLQSFYERWLPGDMKEHSPSSSSGNALTLNKTDIDRETIVNRVRDILRAHLHVPILSSFCFCPTVFAIAPWFARNIEHVARSWTLSSNSAGKVTVDSFVHSNETYGRMWSNSKQRQMEK